MRFILVSVFVFSFTPAPSSAQVAPVGSETTFDFATWNIEWFGSGSNGPDDFNQQRENARAIIEQSGIEFWALQEISETFQFNRLVDSLGTNWVGQLATIPSGGLRIAFVYNTDVVRQANAIHILKSDDQLRQFAGRAPLRLTTDIMLPDTTVSITFITVHMKCCGGADDRNRREAASTSLKTHMDFALPRGRPIILLGDLNDELRFSISGARATPYQNFLDDPDNYFFATTEMDRDREFTWCGSNTTCSFGSTLDHILISNELFNRLVDNRAYRLDSVIDAFDDPPRYVNSTSDHLPVYARLVFSTTTATEPTVEIPGGFRIRSVYPNPARDLLTVELGGNPGKRLASAQLIDILGRVIDVPVGDAITTGTLHIDTSQLAPGLFMIRVSDGSRDTSATFVRVR